MNEITTEEGLEGFFRHEQALLFLQADWSQYAVLSKRIIEFVEGYAKAGRYDVTFEFGAFEASLAPLAYTLISRGVPSGSFTGNGSLCFFKRGVHIHTINSVLGEGTYSVWKLMDEIFEKPKF